jgi:hypothetical protein
MKGIFIFLVLLIATAINLEDNIIARLGFEPTYLYYGIGRNGDDGTDYAPGPGTGCPDLVPQYWRKYAS